MKVEKNDGIAWMKGCTMDEGLKENCYSLTSRQGNFGTFSSCNLVGTFKSLFLEEVAIPRFFKASSFRKLFKDYILFFIYL
jgi:hypothetical protein